MESELKKAVDVKTQVQPEVASNVRYDKEFRDQLVGVYKSGIYNSAAECARSYQVPERLLYQWINQSKNSSNSSEQNLELTRLKRENSQLKMENEVLKKATVYFAKQMK